MRVLDKAKGHYKALLSASPLKIEIPEWETTAYVKPGINLAQMGEILELSQSGKTAEAMAMTLIYMAGAYGGSMSAILLNVPGAPASAATSRGWTIQNNKPSRSGPGP